MQPARYLLRTVALPKGIGHWSLTTLKEKLIQIRAKVIRHAGYSTFQMAEVAVPRKLSRAILRRIAGLRRAIARAAQCDEDVGGNPEETRSNGGRGMRPFATAGPKNLPCDENAGFAGQFSPGTAGLGRPGVAK